MLVRMVVVMHVIVVRVIMLMRRGFGAGGRLGGSNLGRRSNESIDRRFRSVRFGYRRRVLMIVMIAVTVGLVYAGMRRIA